MTPDVDLGLQDRCALVTGAGAGIGRGVAVWLARAGCHVAVVDLDDRAADATAGAIRDLGRTAVPVMADVRTERDTQRMVADTITALGRIDIAVNNVGMLGGRSARPFLEMDEAYLRDVIDQNLLATALSCRAEARAMATQGSGTIINVSSGESRRPALGLAPYGAAKAAINHLTQTLAAELGPHGIRVNAVAPGTTLTDRVRAGLDDAFLDALRASIPLGRLAEPDDMARVVVFLASDLARYVTGQFILADGGAELSRDRPTRRAKVDVP